MTGQSSPIRSRSKRSGRPGSTRTVASWSPKPSAKPSSGSSVVTGCSASSSSCSSTPASGPSASSIGTQPRWRYVAVAGSEASGPQPVSLAHTSASPTPLTSRWSARRSSAPASGPTPSATARRTPSSGRSGRSPITNPGPSSPVNRASQSTSSWVKPWSRPSRDSSARSSPSVSAAASVSARRQNSSRSVLRSSLVRSGCPSCTRTWSQSVTVTTSADCGTRASTASAGSARASYAGAGSGGTSASRGGDGGGGSSLHPVASRPTSSAVATRCSTVPQSGRRP